MGTAATTPLWERAGFGTSFVHSATDVLKCLADMLLCARMYMLLYDVISVRVCVENKSPSGTIKSNLI